MDTKNMLRLFFPSFIPLLLIVSLVLSGIKMNDSVQHLTALIHSLKINVDAEVNA